MRKEFLKKLFSIDELMGRVIITFSQNKNEQLHENLEIFKDLMRNCPHHEVLIWHLVVVAFCIRLMKALGNCLNI